MSPAKARTPNARERERARERGGGREGVARAREKERERERPHTRRDADTSTRAKGESSQWREEEALSLDPPAHTLSVVCMLRPSGYCFLTSCLSLPPSLPPSLSVSAPKTITEPHLTPVTNRTSAHTSEACTLGQMQPTCPYAGCPSALHHGRAQLASAGCAAERRARPPPSPALAQRHRDTRVDTTGGCGATHT